MDSIGRTADNAFVQYFNITRRIGYVPFSVRAKLLVLGFLKNLVHTSDTSWVYEEINGVSQWVRDQSLIDEVRKVFKNNLKCLEKGSCIIKHFPDDCTTLYESVDVIETETTGYIQLLLLNDSYPIGDSREPNIVPFVEAMNHGFWVQDTAFIRSNDADGITDETLLSY